MKGKTITFNIFIYKEIHSIMTPQTIIIKAQEVLANMNGVSVEDLDYIGETSLEGLDGYEDTDACLQFTLYHEGHIKDESTVAIDTVTLTDKIKEGIAIN